MSERSEFLSSRKTSAERRRPEGQGAGAPFLCFLSLGEQREEVVVWGRNPEVFGLREKQPKVTQQISTQSFTL